MMTGSPEADGAGAVTIVQDQKWMDIVNQDVLKENYPEKSKGKAAKEKLSFRRAKRNPGT